MLSKWFLQMRLQLSADTAINKVRWQFGIRNLLNSHEIQKKKIKQKDIS